MSPLDLTREQKIEAIALLEEKVRRKRRRYIHTLFPDTGPLRRELYQKHLEFFRAGAKFRQRGVLAANRVGKSETMSLYETVLHCTGDYPRWWEGRRFESRVRFWVCGETAETVRDILQRKLLGAPGDYGTGLIPWESIAKKSNGDLRITPGRGISDAVDTIYITHKSGELSEIGLKSYKKGESSFPGVEREGIVLDEEAPVEVKAECWARTMTTRGILIQNFTPLNGMSEAVLDMLPDADWKNLGERDGKYIVRAEWDDVPHLTAEDKVEMLKGFPKYQWDARSKGIPQLGAGAIYPVPESDIVVPPRQIPDYWPRVFGMDVGWDRTAVAWFAKNPDDRVWYLYSEHYMGEAVPAIHAVAIKGRGEWIQGVIDPAARGRGQDDGRRLFQSYVDLGLKLELADNSVESGIYDVLTMLSTGQLKVFDTCKNWLDEFRLYQRDKKGHILKKFDHLMDATRYWSNSGRNIAKTKPIPAEPEVYEYQTGSAPGLWMG